MSLIISNRLDLFGKYVIPIFLNKIDIIYYITILIYVKYNKIQNIFKYIKLCNKYITYIYIINIINILHIE
jgi:hypothetical protein